jgi:hypothetical protein
VTAAEIQPRPILVTGMARSGTTWVGRMLCAGGEAAFLDEPFNLEVGPGAVRVAAEHWYEYVCDENEEVFLSDLMRFVHFRYPLLRELRRCRRPADVLETFRAWRAFGASHGRRAVVKEPNAVFSAEWFARRFRSDVVITVRHPAAVAASWKRLGWSFGFESLLAQPLLMRDHLRGYERELETSPSGADAVDRAALLWRIVYSIVADYRSHFPDFLIIRHEDLSRDPLGEYERLYASLGLRFAADAAAAVAASSSSANPKRAATAYETRLDSAANLDAWRTRLTSDELRRVRALTDETASLFYGELEW